MLFFLEGTQTLAGEWCCLQDVAEIQRKRIAFVLVFYADRFKFITCFPLPLELLIS